jgi:hypothetical protein
LFLAQITQGIYKKGVFFEVDNNGKIKVTQARYCLLTNCQNRNLAKSSKIKSSFWSKSPLKNRVKLYYTIVLGNRILVYILFYTTNTKF